MASQWKWFEEKLYSHVETWRLYTVLWCGLLSLLGACLVYQEFPPIFHTFLVLTIPILGWISGLYLSDYLDSHLDKIQKSHRPIPSGRMHPYEALITGALFACIGIGLTTFLGIKNFILVLCAALLVYCYARFTKSFGILGNLNRGALAVITFLFGAFSFGNSLTAIPASIWLLCIVFFLHDMNTNLVGTLRDIESDKKGGYLTVPAKYGLAKAVYLAIILSVSWFFLSILVVKTFFIVPYIVYFFIILESIILVLICYYLIMLIKHYSRKNALTVHKYFVLERITLVSLVIMILIPVLLGLVVYMISLILSFFFQVVLRDQYEFAKWEL